MKNMIKLFCFLFLNSLAYSQDIKPLDTIYANEQKTVALFFPQPIRQGITGSANYAFSYNRDREQYFGLLQATPGEESNLLVVTKDGDVYSYLLRYSDSLAQLSYFVSEMASIGNERTGSFVIPKQKIDSIVPEAITDTTNLPDYQKLCSQLLRHSRDFDQISHGMGISIGIAKSIYHGNEVYIVVEINNASEIDFEINSLVLSKVNGNNRRRASYQELPLVPVYQFNMPDLVLKGQTVQIVLVYPKFTLGKGERLRVRLDELNGGREIF
jgi:hypothetical protein